MSFAKKFLAHNLVVVLIAGAIFAAYKLCEVFGTGVLLGVFALTFIELLIIVSYAYPGN